MTIEEVADRLCPIPPDADALPRVIARSAALERGISRQAISRRLRSGTWRAVLPRTYRRVESLGAADRLAAALTFAGDGSALSGQAALWASQVRQVVSPSQVLVLVAPDNRVHSREWVRVQRSYRPIVAQNWSGPRRVEAARAAADVARCARHLDDVRTVLARVVRLRRGGVTGFGQNVRLVLRGGVVGVVDFYWPRLRAALEIDSVEWHADSVDWRRTWERHLEVTASGISVVHQPPSALRDSARFVADIRAWLASRAAELGVTET